MGSLQAQRTIQTRWWHYIQVLQGQANSGLSLWWREEESNPVAGYGVRFLAEQPNPQNPVTDSVESCLLQGLRYYEFRRAVIIRSIGRPKFVCVPTAPAQLRGVRFS